MKRRFFMLAAIMTLCLCACGGNAEENFQENDSVEESDSDDGEIGIEDLEGFWYPAEGIGSTTSVLVSVYINGTAETWEEYDQYGNLTEYSGDAYTDGAILTLADVPLIGNVEIPIADADTLVTDTGETYWIKGEPDFQEEPEAPDMSTFSGQWFYKGDQDPESAKILTLNEDGTYTRGNVEEGTYTYEEKEVHMMDTDTTVFRQEISLSASGLAESFYLVSDGQVLIYWSGGEDNYYIYEDALEDEQLLAEYNLTDGTFWGSTYVFDFNQGYALVCDFLDGTTEKRYGTWTLSGDTVTIIWEDGETDEGTLELGYPDTLTMLSADEILEHMNPF